MRRNLTFHPWSYSTDNLKRACEFQVLGHLGQHILVESQKSQWRLPSDKLTLVHHRPIEEKLLWKLYRQAAYKPTCCWLYLRRAQEFHRMEYIEKRTQSCLLLEQ